MSFRSLPIGLVIENSKKREYNSKKIKNYNCGFISSQIGWKRLRDRKEKLSFRFVPYWRVRENSRKIEKKFNKLKKKYHYGFISSQNRLGKAKKEKNKNLFPFPSDQTGNRKFQKKIRNSKKSKIPLWLQFKPK